MVGRRTHQVFMGSKVTVVSVQQCEHCNCEGISLHCYSVASRLETCLSSFGLHGLSFGLHILLRAVERGCKTQVFRFFTKKPRNLKSTNFSVFYFLKKEKTFKIHILNLQSQQKIVAFQSNQLCSYLCYSLHMAINDVAGECVYHV